MAALDSKASGKMGMRAVVYYMTTTVIAVVIGIIIVIIIHPGKGTKENMHREGKIVQVTAADAFLDLIRYVLASPSVRVYSDHPTSPPGGADQTPEEDRTSPAGLEMKVTPLLLPHRNSSKDLCSALHLFSDLM